MRKFFLLIILSVFILLSQGCKNVDCSLDKIDQYYLKAGSAYSFKMLDEYGKSIAEGKIIVSFKQKLKISGTYTIDNVYQKSFSGLENMKDEFTASESENDNTVTMNMNPKITYNNVIFEFRLMMNKIEGRWYYNTPSDNKSEGDLTGMKLN